MLRFLDLDTTFVTRSESKFLELCADACNSVSSRLSVNSSNHSGRSANGSVDFSCHPSFFLFWVLGVHLHHFRGAISLLRSDTGPEEELDESCGGDVEDEKLHNWWITLEPQKGTKLSVLHVIVFPSLVNRGF